MSRVFFLPKINWEDWADCCCFFLGWFLLFFSENKLIKGDKNMEKTGGNSLSKGFGR